MKLLFLLFWGLFSTALSFKFEDCGTPSVNFGEYLSDSHTQTIDIDESNNGERVCLVLVASLAGDLDYKVISDLSVPVSITKEEGPTRGSVYLTINRVDYEALNGAKSVLIDVTENWNINTKQSIILNVINIDDEPPTLLISDCRIDEGLTISFDKACEFKISDPDGFLDKMVFSVIPGKKHEEDIFELTYKDTPPTNSHEAPVYLLLQDDQTLDYDKATYYSFSISVTDSGNHKGKEHALVEVNELPRRPPHWVNSFSTTIVITEEQTEEIQVLAVDGNTALNYAIFYEIENPSLDCITVDRLTGLITVAPIDRDQGHDQVTFTVKACLQLMNSSCTTADITLIVKDIDDNVAVITSKDINNDPKKSINISVNEGTKDLGLRIFASDIDLAENAVYTCNLIKVDSFDYTTAFSAVPSHGYQTTILTLAVDNPEQLDFEDPQWQIITFQLQVEGIHNNSMADIVDITINLNDINDEIPIFEHNEYDISIPENVKAGKVVINIQATDKDAEDANLTHYLKGILAGQTLKIEDFGGDIIVAKDEAFDYEKQQEVIVDIFAVDKVKHTSMAQLTITITDVNDENPVLHVPYAVSIKENQLNGFKFANITATDIDSVPYLEFSIDWDKSYVTKNAEPLSHDDFAKLQFVVIETIRDNTNNNSIIGNLVVNEITVNNTPNFEEFDTLYLYLVVTDTLTEVAGKETDSALIEINIIDVNDNPPEFATDAQSEKRFMLENSVNGTAVTTVVATDPDIGTVLSYTIEGRNASTPQWVAIDQEGLITVSLPPNQELDCDEVHEVPLYNLTYRVKATDGVFTSAVIITIDIIDQNDNMPTLTVSPVNIPELTNGDTSHNGDVILELHPKDIDRDIPYHTVTCSFSPSTSEEVTKRFKIVNNTVILDLEDNVNLDREEIDSFSFETICVDNPGEIVSNVAMPPAVVSITLDDINDNVPTIKDHDSIVVNENIEKGLIATLQGEDLDRDDNGVIASVELVHLQRFYAKNDQKAINDTDPSELFEIEVSNDNQLNLFLKRTNLEGFYGYLNLTVKLTDKGSPPLSNEVLVGITVQKYSFYPLVFENPKVETFFLLPTQTVNSSLVLIDGTNLPPFKATDQQGNKFVTEFKIIESSENMFRINQIGSSEGQLEIVTPNFNLTRCSLTIEAYHTEDPEQTAVKTINIDSFDPVTGFPVFEQNKSIFHIYENETDATYQIPRAHYNLSDLVLPIYYLLEEGNQSLFNVDQETGLLSVLKPLKYKENGKHTLVIQASNSNKKKDNATNDAKFTLTINVLDINDNPPKFDQKQYEGVLKISNTCPNASEVIVTVHATDIDTTSQGRLRYAIDAINASEAILQTIANPFYIDNEGNIKSNFQVLKFYKGYFVLTVIVYDEDNKSDTTEVTINVKDVYSNVFSFANEVSLVENVRGEIKRILDENFSEYVINVGTPMSDRENTRTNIPISFLGEITKEDSDVLKKSNFRFFNKLKSEFSGVGLTLLSFDSDEDSS